MQTAIIEAREDRVHEEGIRTSVGLVDAAVRGDRGAFERLVEPYLAVALGAARLITGNESDAADAVQDALLASWQSLDGLRDPELFAAWFRKIVIRSSTRSLPVVSMSSTQNVTSLSGVPSSSKLRCMGGP